MHERPPAEAAPASANSGTGIEIERKFLVKALPDGLERQPSEPLSQGYLAIGEGGLEVRLRRRGEDTTLTVKQGVGRARREEEIAMDHGQFERLWPLTEGRRVEKSRQVISTASRLVIELDTYGEDLAGLTTAEVEFETEAEADAFEPPEWFGPEVTDDERYKNQRLACNGAPPPPRAAPEPFRLHTGEPASDGIRRIVRGQIDAAIDDLGAGALEDPGAAVHSVRKRFKRVRAVVRLIRDLTGADVYRRENATFRDLGRRLSGARDSQVLIETLDGLCGRYVWELPTTGFAELRAGMVGDLASAERHLREDTVAGAPIIAELRAARIRAAAWPLERAEVGALAPGFERIHRRGRRAFLAARADPSDETFHELRKRTKDLWHAAQILRVAAPKKMKTLADRSHRLSDLVGDDHDLAVLSQQTTRRPERFADEAEAARLTELVARRRSQIQSEALEVAERVFAAKSRRLARRIELA